MSELFGVFILLIIGHNGWVTSLTVGEDADKKPLLISGSRDKSLIVWKLNLDNPTNLYEDVKDQSKFPADHSEVGKPYKSLHGHNHFVSSVSISRDSKYVVSGSWDKTLRLWDLNNFTCKSKFIGHTKDVLTATFSSDNRMILSGGMDNTLRIWNTQGDLKASYPEFGGWVSSITQIKQDKDTLLAVGSWDSKVRIFDNELKYQRGIEGLNYGITSLATDSDGEYLFVGEKNGTVRVWSLAGENNESDTVKQKIDLKVDLNVVYFDSNHFSVLTYGTSKGISIREIKGNKEITSLTYGNNTGCLCLAMDAKKQYMFAGFTDGNIRVFKYISNSDN